MDVLTVAHVRRAHGLAGEVLVHAETDDGDDVFVPGRRLAVRPVGNRPSWHRELTVTASRPHRGGYLLHFEEVTDRDAAEALLGAELLLDREALRPLEEDEYFLHELVGLALFDTELGELGRIDEVYDAAGQLLASVRVDGRERLVPLRRETVVRVDREAGRIDVSLPTGLLEV